MSDILKMDDPLAVPQPSGIAETRASALRPATVKWAIWGTLIYAIPAVGMVGYAFWVAAHLGR